MFKKAMVALVLCFILGGFAAPALACAWDQDTLAQEAEGIEDVLSIVMGAFPRNPPLYYEMRLERAQKAFAKDATLWEEYDNAGVAADRLGQHDLAIQIMQAKHHAMSAAEYDGATEEQPNHSYRYKANIGTFYAHRWFANGKDFAKLEDINTAAGFIQAAIKENPNAHFGREKYQLQFLEWIASDPSKIVPEYDSYGQPTRVYPNALSLWVFGKGKRDRPDAKELDEISAGLTGLMKLGAAWESLDALMILREVMLMQGHSSVDQMIAVRIKELIAKGHEYILSNQATPEEAAKGQGEKGRWDINLRAVGGARGDFDQKFADAKAQVTEWQEARASFMLAKLNAGEHPDTHADFWDGFANPQGFKIDFGPLNRAEDAAWAAEDEDEEGNWAYFFGSFFAAGLGLVILFLGGFFVFAFATARLLRRRYG